VPTVAAVERINALEPFDRGWYAGPVGWLGRDGAEFAVAIRSALVREQRVRAYTGAGIVSGSAAPREWEELENKMSTLQSILAIND
ncbi:MAG: chorismate-binding protein, partial [Candidatus Hydrogenedentes bacterium]|nr:chorismate-binding protein [Candidatus Hydrogenedentota bacterium]